MDESIWGFIGVITGTFIGAAASIITTFISNNNAMRIQQNIDEQQRTERARSFQRDTLLEIQDVLSDALRLMTQAYIERSNANDEGIPWEDTPINNAIDENARLTNRKLAILNEIISDDTLRCELHDVRDKMSNIIRTKSNHEARTAMFDSSNDARIFLKNLGVILRSQY